MARLRDLAKLVRSKNAGPFTLTFDVLFDDEQKYLRVKNSNVLNKPLFAQMWKIDESQVDIFHYDPAWAIKISVPRYTISGSPDDSDVFGGQQYGPLVNLEVPDGNMSA